MTVYAVAEGDYDDYRIIAVFSTREKAEKLIKDLAPALDCPSIEVWRVDDDTPVLYTWQYTRYVNPQGHQGNAKPWEYTSFDYCQIVEQKDVWIRVNGNSKEEVEQLMEKVWEERYASSK
jgi:hypothetical protein